MNNNSLDQAINLLIPLVMNKMNSVDQSDINKDSIGDILKKIFDDKQFMDSISKITNEIKFNDTYELPRTIRIDSDKTLLVSQENNHNNDEKQNENDTNNNEKNEEEITSILI